MKLHSPDFERALRRGVRLAIRSSRELKQDYRRANKFRQHYNSILLVRPAFGLGLPLFVWLMANRPEHTASALAGITLWGFAFVFIQAQRLLTCLYAAPDLPALSLLPVPVPTIFRWEMQRFIRGALWLFFDLLAAYAVLAACNHFSPLQWLLTPLAAAVTWVEVLALAMVCVTRFPALPYQLLSGGLVLLGFVLFVSWGAVGGGVIALVDASGSNLNFLLPTGWGPLLFQALMADGHGFLIVMAIPLGAVLFSVPSSLRRLQALYEFKEQLLPESPDLVPGEETEQSSSERYHEGEPTRIGPTAIEEIIQLRQFLAGVSWKQRGWIERMLWKWLTPRERALAEFAFPDGVSLVRPWRKVFRNLAVAWLVALVTGLVWPWLSDWIFGVGLFFTGCLAVFHILGSGRVFRPVESSGVTIPFHAGYPVGFRELARFLFKVSLVQLLPLVLLSVAASVAVFYRIHLPAADGLLFGLKLAGLILASRLVFVACAFSSGTNDTSNCRLRTLGLVLFVVVAGLGFVVLAGASLFVPDPRAAWLCWGLAFIDAYTFFAVYSWFYNRNKFDLMKFPNPRV